MAGINNNIDKGNEIRSADELECDKMWVKKTELVIFILSVDFVISVI